MVTRANHHLGRRVFIAGLAVPGICVEPVALPFLVIAKKFQGSLTMDGSRDFPRPGLGAYRRQIRQLLDRLD